MASFEPLDSCSAFCYADASYYLFDYCDNYSLFDLADSYAWLPNLDLLPTSVSSLYFLIAYF